MNADVLPFRRIGFWFTTKTLGRLSAATDIFNYGNTRNTRKSMTYFREFRDFRS